jgi:two-component system, OmpR family, sensor kinase
MALVAGIFSFLSTFNEAYELQDDVLRQVAALMDRQHLTPDVLAGRGSREGNEESRVIVQRLGDARQAPLGVDDGGPLPHSGLKSYKDEVKRRPLSVSGLLPV